MPARPPRSPTVRHKRLTAEFRRLRAEAGLTRDDVAGRLDWHPTKITRIETGLWTRLTLRAVRDLPAIYGVTDEAQREALIRLPRDARQRACCHPYGAALPRETSHSIVLAAQAA